MASEAKTQNLPGPGPGVGVGGAVNLGPQAHGSLSFASFLPLPFLPGIPEATGLLVGTRACACLSWWRGREMLLADQRAPGSLGGPEQVAHGTFELLQDSPQDAGQGKDLNITMLGQRRLA